MNALSIENLTKKYSTFTLDHISFEVKDGHIAGLIGRNGAGKSTAIKSMLRFISAEGNVRIFGKDICKEESEAKQLVGYVGGGFRYYALKKLGAIRKVYSRFYPQWDGRKYEELLHRFALDESKKVRELSEGMKVKFSLALALSHGAKLLIMDEPTSGLDPLSREEFCDIVLALVKEQGISVLFSTHITSDLMRIADDIVYISQGKILADSSLNELLAKYYLAHFSTLEQARKCDAIGIKTVKDGYEGLILRQSDFVAGIDITEATIDNIMIHLENTQREGIYV